MSLIILSLFFLHLLVDALKEIAIESYRQVDQESDIYAVRNEHPLDQLGLVDVPHKSDENSD